MANMFSMMKKAAAMQLKMRRIQKELGRIELEAKSGDVTVTASCDMAVKRIRWEPGAYDPARPERFEKMLVAATNSALEQAKKRASEEMAKMSGGLEGLAEKMLG